MITHVHSITIYVRDQDRALAFYRDALGMEVLSDDSSIPGFRWLTVGPKGAQTSLLIYKANPDHKEDTAKLGSSTGLVLYADDIHVTHDKLKAHGVKITTELRKEMWGWELQFADPDGNTFELVQPAAR